MVRFSCFLPHINYHRSKKVVQHSAEVMSSNPEEGSQGPVIKATFCSDHNRSSASAEQITSPSSHGGCWKSEDLSGNTCPDDGKDFLQTVRLKKSMSLGSVLDKRRGFPGEDLTEDDEMDREFSFDYSHDDNLKRVGDSFDNAGSAEVNAVAESFDLVDPVHPESLFSIGVLKQSDGEQHDDVGARSTDPVVESLHLSSNTLPLFAKSHSVTNIRMGIANSDEGTLTHELTGPRSRSFEDLYSLLEGRDGSLNGDDTVCSEIAFQRYIAAPYYHDTTEASYLDGKGSQCHADSGEECLLSNASGGFDEVADRERQDEYSSEKFEWREPETNGVVVKENLQQDSSNQSWDELTSEEFNIKRIEQWISQIDIQNGNVVEELGESSRSVPKKDHRVVAGVTSARLGSNSLGMELAYNYISSLTPTSSSAQMSNLGLVAVPFLNAFVSLRVLNLSGNAIVRITSGALPRGLHMLNLSKNNISAIEGLRDLTRLRVLDLSYNRIVRIGHGLASCSSLKELYLAGNKVSEVEGLHRLLKLNVLDLRLNKISTAKGLGQLAANYASLQAINLEGNPAQRNVGDEQLKKYLLSLLPHLVYINKQAIRASGSKEISDRPPRSITTSHQFDRGMRTEQNHSRRGAAHGSALHRSSSSNHSRSNPAAAIASSKQSKNHRHVRLLPPTGSKATSNHPADTSTKLSSLKPINPIRRSLSEGTL